MLNFSACSGARRVGSENCLSGASELSDGAVMAKDPKIKVEDEPGADAAVDPKGGDAILRRMLHMKPKPHKDSQAKGEGAGQRKKGAKR